MKRIRSRDETTNVKNCIITSTKQSYVTQRNALLTQYNARPDIILPTKVARKKPNSFVVRAYVKLSWNYTSGNQKRLNCWLAKKMSRFHKNLISVIFALLMLFVVYQYMFFSNKNYLNTYSKNKSVLRRNKKNRIKDSECHEDNFWLMWYQTTYVKK